MSPHGYFLVQSLRRKRVESGLPSADFAVKGEGPAFGRARSAMAHLIDDEAVAKMGHPNSDMGHPATQI
jgi:hypothetical protein